MLDAVEGECGGDQESQREPDKKPNVNLGESRSRDECDGVSSGAGGQEKVGGLCREEDDERTTAEILAAGYATREYDYIRFSNVASCPRILQKRDYGDLGKLGPKTKETELRLGLPVEAEQNDGLDAPGSRRGALMRTSEACNGLEGFRGSVVGKGGSTCHNLHGLLFTGEVGGRFLAGAEPRDRGHEAQNQEELKQRMMFEEFAVRELPFDIRFSQKERWAKPMMVMPPLNSYYRTAGPEDRRAFSYGGKRVFSDTLQGRPNVPPQLDSPKPPQLRMPQPTFMFPFAGGPKPPQAMWDSTQSKTNLGNFAGHMGANLPPALTPEMRIVCVGEASSSQSPRQVPVGLPTLAPSENKSRQAQAEDARNEDEMQSGPRTSPVVGWPPIRSFRKNLASQPKVAPAPAPAPGPAPATVPSPAPDPVAADPAGRKNSKTMFVKVNVEGNPIGRKIDLKAYDGYEKLSVALDEMFRGSIPAQKAGANPSSENNEPSLLSGRDFVLVYEDDEGDRMLVGDVPWGMFVSTVKRLRVIKSSEARGLAANRQLTKTAQ